MTKFDPSEFALAPVPRAPKIEAPEHPLAIEAQDRVLNAMSRDWASAGDIAARAGIGHSSIYRHLDNLQGRGVIDQQRLKGRMRSGGAYAAEFRLKEVSTNVNTSGRALDG